MPGRTVSRLTVFTRRGPRGPKTSGPPPSLGPRRVSVGVRGGPISHPSRRPQGLSVFRLYGRDRRGPYVVGERGGTVRGQDSPCGPIGVPRPSVPRRCVYDVFEGSSVGDLGPLVFLYPSVLPVDESVWKGEEG